MKKHSSEVARLKRISGQINGIIKMIEEEEYCVDIINQLTAIHSAVASARTKILENHLKSYITSVIEEKNNQTSGKIMTQITELMDLLKRF